MESTMDIESLILFRAVVEQGSFTAAANLLNKDKAHVSRVISRLEKRLEVQLLWRSTRRLAVSEVGRELYERAVSILGALEETQNVLASTQSEPMGHLRISAGSEFGVMRVNHWVAEYMKRYPKVRVEADYSNRLTDVIHEGIDVAIRVGPLPDSDLSARSLGEIKYGLYASPTYLAHHEKLKHPSQLSEHSLVVFSPRGKAKWVLTNKADTYSVDTEPTFQVNNNLAARDIAASGMGVVLLPLFQASPLEKAGTLVRVLEQWEKTPVKVSALFASSRYMAPKVRAFIDIALEFF
jgi:DNA-binding transcriptional LysR family regulator